MFLQYLKENVKDEVDVLPAEKRQRFLQIDTIILGVCVARHVQITQSNKFAISLQYLKKEVSDEVDFLPADNHERFLQIDTMIFDGGWSSIPKVPKIASLQCLYNISRKKLEMKFLHADKHQSFL